MNLNTEEYRGPGESSYAERTPLIIKRTWEDFQRNGFCTSIMFAPFANSAIAHCAMIFNGQGNVVGQAETQAKAIHSVVERANIAWPAHI